MTTDRLAIKSLRRHSIACVTAASLAAFGGLWVVGGGAAGAQPPRRPHLLSATVPPAAPPTSVSTAFNLSIGRSGHTVAVSGAGKVDFVHGAADATVLLPALGHLTTAPTPLPVELVGNTVYVKVPTRLLGDLGGATWVSISLPAAVTARLPADFTTVAEGLGHVPAILALHSGPLTPLGTKVIDGVTATGTSATFPLSALLDAIPGVPSTLAARLDRLIGTTSLPLSLWADPQGRLVELTLNDTLTGKGGPVTVAATVDLTDYDAPVSIHPPPPGQVKPLPAGALKMLGGALGTAAPQPHRWPGHGSWKGRLSGAHGTFDGHWNGKAGAGWAGHWSGGAHTGATPSATATPVA